MNWNSLKLSIMSTLAAFAKGALFAVWALLTLITTLLVIAHVAAFADVLNGELSASAFLILTPACITSGGLAFVAYGFYDSLF